MMNSMPGHCGLRDLTRLTALRIVPSLSSCDVLGCSLLLLSTRISNGKASVSSRLHRVECFHWPNSCGQGTDFLVILRDAVPVGRLAIARWQDEIRMVDIALLPPSRNAGIGTAILRDILVEAAAAHKPVRIHVEQCNPALRLYERLGFAPIEDKGVYLFMEWAP